MRQGRHAIIEQFLADGIHYMFGNPGTVEQGFLDAIAEYPDFEYVLSLQESIAVGIGDGYARATRRPTVVQLHSGVGLGNGIGMMYQAMRGHAPLVVVASEAGIRYDAMDSQMAADLVGMARPVTKWAARVVDPASTLRMLRRAIKIAMTPPTGPVFLCLPADVLDAENTEPIHPTSIPNTRVGMQDEDARSLAAMFAGAEHPLIIMGDGIAWAGAQAELARAAEALGAPVWGADNSEVNLPADHPCYQGNLGHMFGANSARVVQQADAVLVVGTYVFPEVYPYLDPEQIFQPGARVAHMDLNTYEIAKNFRVDCGLAVDPKIGLQQLNDALDAQMTEAAKQAAAGRVARLAEQKAANRQAAVEADHRVANDVPLQTSRFMAELARQAPADTIVFDEALTSSPPLTRYLPPNQPDSYFATRGGSLGVGVPGALGLKLAFPDKTVIGFTGDGGAMYTIQALWTAAHHKINAKFVICNNQSYMLLKLNILQYWREQIGVDAHAFPESFDLKDPVVDFAGLSRALGVPAARVDHPDQVESAIRDMLATDGPFLIDMVVSSALPDPSSGK